MGHDKLRKFAENETFSCLLQPSAQELLADGYFNLRDHAVKGHWDRFFDSLAGAGSPLQDFALRAHPSQPDGWAPPVHEATGGHGPAGETLPPPGQESKIDDIDFCSRIAAVAGARTDIVLELGCGKGEYTIALAERHPERDYIGVDIKGARLWKGAKYATEHRLPNVAFLRTRVEFITAFFAPGEVSEVWLTFSDPQFRSENSRLSSPLFLERYRSFMKPGGVVHLKTDSRFLHEYTRAVCELNGLRILACTIDLYGMSPGDKAAPAVPPEDRSHPRLRKREGPTSEKSASADRPGPGTLHAKSERDLRAAGGSGDMPPYSMGWGPAQPDVCGRGLPVGSPAEIPEEVRSVQTFYEKLFLEQGYPITYLSFVIDHDGPYRSPVEAGTFDTDYWRSVEGPRLLFGHDSAETRRQKLKEAAARDE